MLSALPRTSVVPNTSGFLTLPRRFEPALLRAPSKALVVRRTRLDAGQPELQNWEVALDVVRADPATADGDELLALWMNARTGADGVSDTGLSLARSIDGGRNMGRDSDKYLH